MPAYDLVIDDANIVDVSAGTIIPHQNVGVSATRITAITNSRLSVGVRGVRLSANGRYLIPGLWDMHSHSLWDPEALATFLPVYVANGVTGIRDMGGTLAVLRAARDSLRRGTRATPRLYAAGVILDGPSPVDPSISIAVRDSSTAIAALDSLRSAGADFVKVYTLLPRAAYFATVAEARRRGLSVVGHVPAAVSVAEAVRAGQRSIEHLNDELEPFCTSARRAACDSLVPLFIQHQTWQTPTLAALRMKGFAADSGSPDDPRLRYVPQSLRKAWLVERRQKLDRGAEYKTGKLARYNDELWLAGMLHQAGVPMLAGSDAGVAFVFPGFSLHDELEGLVASGFTPLDALRSATLAPARFMHAADSIGSIAVGKSADLVLLRDNPLVQITATRTIDAVILRGRFFSRVALDSLLVSAEAAAARARSR